MGSPLLFSLAVLLNGVSTRLNPELSLTPPMGFNTWNYFALNITEQIVKEIADAFIDLGLDTLGYKYINIDDGWAHVERADDGHVIVDAQKFPNGIKHVADYVHSKGLKFGIYSDGGNLTCGGQAGSLDYQEIDAGDYDAWGVDFLKYDNCNNQGIPQSIRYSAMSQALNRTSRDIFFSICNWGEHSVTEWSYKMGAGSWRISGDVWDAWGGVIRNLKWLIKETNPQGYGPRIGWNDPDMLEVGNGGMNTEEYISHFSLWCVLKAPLILGNDLRSLSFESDEYYIITNKEAIAVDQDPLGMQGFCIQNCQDFTTLQTWFAPLSDGAYAILVINFADSPKFGISLCWKDLYLGKRAHRVRDLWKHEDLGIHDECCCSFDFPPHGSVFLKVWRIQ